MAVSQPVTTPSVEDYLKVVDWRLYSLVGWSKSRMQNGILFVILDGRLTYPSRWQCCAMSASFAAHSGSALNACQP